MIDPSTWKPVNGNEIPACIRFLTIEAVGSGCLCGLSFLSVILITLEVFQTLTLSTEKTSKASRRGVKMVELEIWGLLMCCVFMSSFNVCSFVLMFSRLVSEGWFSSTRSRMNKLWITLPIEMYWGYSSSSHLDKQIDWKCKGTVFHFGSSQNRTILSLLG